MLPMDEIECIRFLRQKKGKTPNEIADVLDRHWTTVKKYGDAETIPPPKKRRRSRPVIGEFEETVRGWLEEDARKNAKDRRNAAAIHHELTELGYEGKPRTTRYWVSKWKKQILEAKETAHVRLDHVPGEAQIDLFEVWVIDPAREYARRKMYLLAMSFPHSSAALGVLVPAQNTECVLQGLIWLFDELDGVPPVLIFDNLSPVVKQVLFRDKRRLTEAFKRFKYDYRFEVRFCNPASGHEKGSVECKGGYVRRRYLRPAPVVEDLASFNRTLLDRLYKDMDRSHYRDNGTIAGLFEADKDALLAGPRKPFDPVRVISAVVNKVGDIKVDGREVHVPWCHPGQRVMVKKRWDTLEVLDENGEKRLGTCPRPYAYDVDTVDWAAEWRLFLNKPRAVEQAHCLKSLPDTIKTFVTEVELGKRSGRIDTLITLFEAGYTVNDVVQALKSAQNYGRLDQASVQSIAGYQTAAEPPEPLDETWTPQALKAWSPDLEKYSLLAGVTSHD